MRFEIDVSGEDILSRDYVVCVASTDGKIIKGFKFSAEIVQFLNAGFSSGSYKYERSQKGKSVFKVRIYCIVLYYIFKSMNLRESISLYLFRDFDGKELEINTNLSYFLKDILRIKIDSLRLGQLSKDSKAHEYAFRMRKDHNKLKNYVSISLKDIEQFLKKK